MLFQVSAQWGALHQAWVWHSPKTEQPGPSAESSYSSPGGPTASRAVGRFSCHRPSQLPTGTLCHSHLAHEPLTGILLKVFQVWFTSCHLYGNFSDFSAKSYLSVLCPTSVSTSAVLLLSEFTCLSFPNGNISYLWRTEPCPICPVSSPFPSGSLLLCVKDA